jgi:hypothetical protein
MSVETVGPAGVVEVHLAAGEGDWWAQEGADIRSALDEHYGMPVRGDTVPPPPDPAMLRRRLRAAAPRLARLTAQIADAFDLDRACAVLVPGLSLAEQSIDDQRIGVFALAALLGDPTANIPFSHAIWDVRNRGDATSGHTSFSENDREAIYHTDNGALPIPERFFLLYAIHAAECGGGLSLLRDGRTVLARLSATPQGRQAIEVLTHTKLPRRIPTAFRPFGDVTEDGYQYSPVFGDKPMWRWRKHGIRKGLLAHPECETPEVRQALDLVIEELENGPDEIVQIIPTDGMLLVNNHITLHGRTAFTDPARHVLRLRFHEVHHTSTPPRTDPGQLLRR